MASAARPKLVRGLCVICRALCRAARFPNSRCSKADNQSGAYYGRTEKPNDAFFDIAEEQCNNSNTASIYD